MDSNEREQLQRRVDELERQLEALQSVIDTDAGVVKIKTDLIVRGNTYSTRLYKGQSGSRTLL